MQALMPARALGRAVRGCAAPGQRGNGACTPQCRHRTQSPCPISVHSETASQQPTVVPVLSQAAEKIAVGQEFGEVGRQLEAR